MAANATNNHGVISSDTLDQKMEVIRTIGEI